MNKGVKTKLNRVFRGMCALFLLCTVTLSVSVSSSVETKADMATDYLEVQVGYMGMSLDEYVEVANYHWADLLGMCSLNSQAYSYFQRNIDGVNYKAILDCANGFYISDIYI